MHDHHSRGRHNKRMKSVPVLRGPVGGVGTTSNFGYKCGSNIKDLVPLTTEIITSTYTLIPAHLWEYEIKTLAYLFSVPFIVCS